MTEILYLCSSFVQSPTEPGWHVVESVFFSENQAGDLKYFPNAQNSFYPNMMDVITERVLCTHL